MKSMVSSLKNKFRLKWLMLVVVLVLLIWFVSKLEITQLPRPADQSPGDRSNQEAVSSQELNLKQKQCTQQPLSACQQAVFDPQSLTCTIQTVQFCCGNQICETGENDSCSDCVRSITQLQADLSADVLFLDKPGKQGFTRTAQTFVTPEQLQLSQVEIGISHAIGRGLGQVQLIRLEDGLLPDQGEVVWQTEFEIHKLSRLRRLTLTLNPTVWLEANQRYALLLQHDQPLADIGVAYSQTDQYPAGQAWLYTPLSPEEERFFSPWRKLEGDWVFSLKLSSLPVQSSASEAASSTPSARD